MTTLTIMAQRLVQLVILALALLVPTGIAAANIDVSLSPGASGAQVTELQSMLAKDSAVYPEGLITGYFGSLTQRAVERFQCNYAIVCTGDPASTGYGRVGPTTRAKLNEVLGDGTVGGGTSGGADVSAPIMTGVSVATTTNSATFIWATNEVAISRVMYSNSRPFLYSTAQSVSEATKGMSHSITISNLAPSTTYFYTLESIDDSGNVTVTLQNPFRTAP